MTPYLKGIHLTLYSWRQYRDKEGGVIGGESLNMAEV